MVAGEKDKITESRIKWTGLFDWKDFYKFCYDWVIDEMELTVFNEDKYIEQVGADSKRKIEVGWTASRKLTDYFKFEFKVKFVITQMTVVEVMQEGHKIKMNQGAVEVSTKGFLIKDYQGKFDKDALRKFFRSIYDRYIISERIDQMEGKVAGDSDEFLNQAKAYLALTGQR
jgi:hypothetical protein